MSAADAPPDEILPKLSADFIRNVASLTVESVLYGMYLITFTMATFHLLRRRGELPCLILAVTTLIMFGLSTFFWASNVSVFVDELQIILGPGPFDGLPSRIRESNATTQKVRYLGDTLFAFSYIIGDAVMAWRIIVISRWKLLQTVALIGLWVGTTAMGLGLFGCMVHADWPPDAELPALCTQMGNVAWVLSLAFNGLATALLIRVAWAHRTAAKVLSSTHSTTKVMRVLEILVASGIVYFILGLLRLTDFAKLTLSPTTTRLTTATQVIEGMLGQLVGLYPTAVTTFLYYESRIFGGEATGGSSNTRPAIQFSRSTAHGRKADDLEGSGGTTVVTLSKKDQSSAEFVSLDQM